MGFRARPQFPVLSQSDLVSHIHTVEHEGFDKTNLEGYVTKWAPHKALQLIM